jgi:prolycopene isomerase
MIKRQYDVIVVGGGVSGLVAGAQLAANGYAPLLIEKNKVPGGCATSFTRVGYHFDTGTSSLSGLRMNGQLWKIFQRIGLEQQFLRPEIRETIISPHLTIQIPADRDALWQTLFTRFPGDNNSLLQFAQLVNGQTEQPLKSGATSFAGIIEQYAFSAELYFLLEALLGNLGLPADTVDGPTGLALFREYILDGGYYPLGGMRSLALALRKIIRQHGGEVILGQEVVSYHGEEELLHSVILRNGEKYQARSFVAAMDARQTLLQMTPSVSDKVIGEKLKSLQPSSSAFMVFLGIDCPLDKLTKHHGHLLHLPEGSMEKIYQSLSDNEMLFSSAGYVYIIVPSRIDSSMAPDGSESLCLFIMAPYRDEQFWEENRQRMIETMVARAEKVLPGLSEHIRVVDSATPMTLERYTGGYQGATYGWQAVAAQSGVDRLSPVTPWGNLFLAGHWTRPGSGLSAAANSGYLAARMAARYLKD